jgi:hypothetical protein
MKGRSGPSSQDRQRRYGQLSRSVSNSTVAVPLALMVDVGHEVVGEM